MTKAEREFRKIMKDKFFDWQDASDEDYRAICCSNYCVCEEIARKAFGWTDKQVEINESRWRKEYRAIYEE